MCETCGCNLHPRKQQPISTTAHFVPAKIAVDEHSHDMLHNIMSRNDHQAARNRATLNRHGIFCVNLMSSPGAGKTSLLESTIKKFGKKYRIAVIEGDLETENDANRIRQQGVPAVQITTGSACHLDAHYIHQALHQLDLENIDLLFIENIGNLVCPAAFDLGQNASVALLSTTEGDDKPLKYPILFQKVEGLVISKIELLDFFDDFSVERAENNFRKLANQNPVWKVSAKTGAGMDGWLKWLNTRTQALNMATKVIGETV
ncbi:hydrogenase nickel incorporation protein HypB [Teredinibacter haidensis]|uniref:hydrogenase nickel incorporation protein HypB n=1 Tax=Teredinibacter haidensis TaxID=2731755 RepID=UPI0009490691|nr:hydrogenase nickel incorporation protein HypB [Teredinibacter haidensis]